MALLSVRRSTVALLAAIAFASIVVSTATAQGGGGGGQQQQQPYENLKFFSKDLPRDSLLTIMRGFTYALGVNCAFCHVEEPPAQPGGRPRLRPPLDDKVEKQTARFMLAMVDTLNSVTLAKVPQRHEAVRITCVTCHRGSPLPGTIETVLLDAVDQYGADSAVARYKRLRENAMSGRYDFTEGPVSSAARTLVGRGKPDVAITLLTMSQEFNPSSADVDLQLGDIYEKSGDKDKAIARYQAALTKRPNDPRARQALTRLGKPPA
jgi:tetratricopeptide (TPR) repeat protein